MRNSISYDANSTFPAGHGSRRVLHVALWLLALAMFPLIWMGGLVTSSGAGLSVPDWPNSFGYNMFALPFGQWIGSYSGGVFYEHSHRLLGTLAGLAAVVCVCLAYGPAASSRWRRIFFQVFVVGSFGFVAAMIAKFGFELSASAYKAAGHVASGFGSLAILALILWRCRTRHETSPLLRRLIVIALLGVIVQGLLGGFRVTETSLTLAKLHGMFGQLLFGYAAALIVVTSNWWTKIASISLDRRPAVLASAILVLLVVTQLVLGIFMRHDPRRDHITGGGAGLAIPDWPLHYGSILPPTNAAELDRINDVRRFDMHLPAVTFGQVYLHFAHRIGAYTTAVVGVIVIAKSLRRPGLLVSSVSLAILLITQIALGVLTVLWRKPADVATFHQATGALVLAVSTVLFVRSVRLAYSAKITGRELAAGRGMEEKTSSTALAGVH